MASTVITMPESSTAISPVVKAESNVPVAAWHHFRDGVEWLNIGEAQDALVAFNRALQQAPNFHDAHVGVGVAYALCSDIYPAIDHLEKAISLEPESFHAHFKLSQLYFKLRVPQKGYEEAKIALQCAPTIQERQMIAQLLREERSRENNGLARPWWNRSFEKPALIVGAIAAIVVIATLIACIH